MTRSLLALALLCAARAAAAAPVEREVLPGGLELWVAPVPGARTVSLRYVIRAGSAHDPPGREGLAHVLEHVLASGRDGELLADARAAGAEMNAFTTRDATRYTLDAPSAVFPALAERLLRSVTSPRPRRAILERELRVIDTEDEFRGSAPSARDLLEEALFGERAEEPRTIGEAASRGAVAVDDLLGFFQDRYTTASTTVILTGDVTPDAARALVERAVLVPPALPDERVAPVVVAPTLPAARNVRALQLAAIVGYALDGDVGACEPLAHLIELRLIVALRLEEAVARDVEVGCHDVRGTPFLLAAAYTPSVAEAELPARIDAAFTAAATRPPTARERALLRRRLARTAEARAADPVALAEALVREAVRPRVGAAATAGAATAPGADGALDVPALQALARRAFRPARRVVLFVSPYGGDDGPRRR